MQLCQWAHGTSICSPPKNSAKQFKTLLNSSRQGIVVTFYLEKLVQCIQLCIVVSEKHPSPAAFFWPVLRLMMKKIGQCAEGAAVKETHGQANQLIPSRVGCLFGFSVWIRQEKPRRSREDRRTVGLLGRCSNRFTHHFDPFCNGLSHVSSFKRRRQSGVSQNEGISKSGVSILYIYI